MNKNWNQVFCLTVVAVAGQFLQLSYSNTAIAQKPVKEIIKQFTSFDMDSDGTDEIDKLTLMRFQGAEDKPLDSTDKIVLVLVEDRLLEKIPRSKLSARDLKTRLTRFKNDLEQEGLTSRFIECDLYSGPKHQDGQTLLAIRRFVKEVDAEWNLQGVVLVGSFPEATLVRRWIWKRQRWNVTIAGKPYKGTDQTDFLRIVPEAVAPRADIVLADLDGNWEDIYVKESRQLESIEALPEKGITKWPVDGQLFESTRYNDNKISFEDFFWIKEDNFQRVDSPSGRLKLKINSTQLQNPEVSQADLRQANPIAVPDILVSRINARQIAVMPDPNVRGKNNNGFLDRKGIPQSFVLAQRIVPKAHLKKDPTFERRLLIDYFDRNHEFRSKNESRFYRTAAVHYGKGLISGERLNKYLRKASPKFSNSADFNNATLLDYVQFLKTPASLKGMSAHSSQWNSSFGSKYDAAKLETAVGGNPWRWLEKKVGNEYHYTPSFVQQGGAADSYIHRTIYENGTLKDSGPNLFIHIGCEVNTPANALKVPYSHEDYGSSNGFQNAESILFFLNGVALASRAKTFYDSPRGFTEELGKSPTSRFGDGWKAYFQVESSDENLKTNVAGNKRTYPWSIIGDWTLQLK